MTRWPGQGKDGKKRYGVDLWAGLLQPMQPERRVRRCIPTGGHPLGGTCVAAQWIQTGGKAGFQQKKEALIRQINELGFRGLHVEDLHFLNGSYVNLEYPLANGQRVKLLEDDKVYLGNQIEVPGSQRCYGVVADDEYLLVCDYLCNGAEPRILCYQRRKSGEA